MPIPQVDLVKIACFVICSVFCTDSLASSLPPRLSTGLVLAGPDIPNPGCPVFVNNVYPRSPAYKAGIRPGDQLVAINEVKVTDLASVAPLLATSKRSVEVTTRRNGLEHRAILRRRTYEAVLRDAGWKEISVALVPANTTKLQSDALQAEMRRLDEAFASNSVDIVFPDRHYPLDKRVFYPGFEAFVWRSQGKVTVGGLEDGPAKQAGVRWGDLITSINNTDIELKSASQIEALLSDKTSSTISLGIERAGVFQKITFRLASAEQVMHQNHWRVLDNKLVRTWVPTEDLHCYVN